MMTMMTHGPSASPPALTRLYDPAAHEPLGVSVGDWSPERARAGIDAILERTRAAFVPGAFWPRHPSDDYGSTRPQDLSLWIGAAGVLWGLARLGAGIGEADVYAAHRAHPDLSGNTGLMQGEIGVLLASWRLAPSQEKLDLLLFLVEESLRTNHSDELFDGVPGTLLAALHVHRITGSERAAAIWRDGAEALLTRFAIDPELGQHLWIQRRRGRLIRSIGAGHGLAGNVASLRAGTGLLEIKRMWWLELHASLTAASLAREQDGLVNWPTAADPYWAEAFPARLQWCHGAPGLITGLVGQFQDHNGLTAVLTAAGELIWRAGPLRKGAGICHGTAGNALALLALHHHTRDARWHDRACALALHALAQTEAQASPRHSLWTGDIGVALVLQACLEGYRGVPIINFL